MEQINLAAYSEFVESITSSASNDTRELIKRLEDLNATGRFNPALLNTVGIGLASESGEFSDLVKKILFHNKSFTDDVHDQLVKELGDVIFYWVNACRALGVDPNAVINKNVAKLSNRYPAGFDAFRAEHKDELGI